MAFCTLDLTDDYKLSDLGKEQVKQFCKCREHEEVWLELYVGYGKRAKGIVYVDATLWDFEDDWIIDDPGVMRKRSDLKSIRETPNTIILTMRRKIK